MISRSFMELDGDAEGAPPGAVTRARGCALVGAASAGAQAEPPDAARRLLSHTSPGEDPGPADLVSAAHDALGELAPHERENLAEAKRPAVHLASQTVALPVGADERDVLERHLPLHVQAENRVSQPTEGNSPRSAAIARSASEGTLFSSTSIGGSWP